MSIRSRSRSLALIISATLFGSSTLQAASVIYDADISIPGAQDGAGLAWNTSNVNWWNGTADVAWPNTAIDQAIFGNASGAAGTVTVGSVNVNRLFFRAPGSGNYTLSGGTITLAGTQPILFSDAGQAPIIGSVLAGTSGVTKTGAGTLSLTANNTLTGGISVNEGILILNAGGMAFDNANGTGGGAITVNPGATLRLANNFNAGYSRPFLINGGTLNTTAGGTADSNNYLNALTLQNGATVSGNNLRMGYHSNPTLTVTGGTASTISSGLTLVNNAGTNLTLNVANVTGDANTDLTIAGAVVDLSGFAGTTITKTGTGTVRLGANGSNTGGWIVNAGTVVGAVNIGAGLGNAATFGTGAITVNAGGTITGAVPFSVSGGNTATRAINLNGGTWEASYVAGGGEYVRTLNLTGGKIASTSTANFIRVSNSGQMALNSLASSTTSTIQLGIDITYQSILATVAAGTTTNGIDLWIQGAITENTGAGSGAKPITKAGLGKLLLTGNSTYTGTTTISAGTLEIGNQGTLGGVAGNYAGDIVNNATLQFATTANQTLSGNFSGTGSLIQKGAGTLTISNAANTYTGNLVVNAGTMVVSGGITAPVIINGGRLNLTGTSSSTITVNAGGMLTGTGSTTGDIALNNGAGILAGVAAVQGGTVTTTGTTNVFVPGAPTGAAVTVDVIRYAGGTSPLAGLSPATNYRAGSYNDDLTKIQLTYTGESKTWSSTTGGNWDVNTGTTWTGGTDNRFYWGDAVTFAGGVNQTVTLVGTLAPSSVTFSNTGNTITLAGSGSIAGPGTVTYSGSGVVVGTMNTYSGVTTIANGANLVTVTSIGNAGSAGNLGTNPVINLGAGGAAGTLNYIGTGETTDRVINFNGTTGGAFINNNGSGLLRFTSNTTTTGSGGKGTFYGGTGTLQLDGNISALGGVLNMTKNDSGTLTLGGLVNLVSTTAGSFTLNAGTVNYNGTLTTTGNFTATSASTANVNGTVSFAGLTVSTIAANTSTFNVNSGGTANFTGGVIIGQNTNSTAGLLNISGTMNSTGTDFRIGNAGANTTTATGTVTLSAGGLLNLPTANTSIWVGNGGATSGILSLNGGTLILNGQIRNDAGTGGVGAGTSTLNLNGGTLKAAGNSATFINTIDTVNVRDGGAIFDTNSFAVTVPDSLDHSIVGGDNAIDGGVTKHGAGTLTLSAVNTYTGNTTINTGTLAIGGAGSLGSGNYAAAIVNYGTLQYSSSAAQTITGVISGNGALVKDTDSASVLTLTGANTYTGATTVNAGTLVVNNTTNSGTGTAAVLVNTGGTLAGNGFIAGAVNIAGGTLAPGNSIDSLDTGTLSFTGGTFLAEINTTALTADLVNVTGDLNLAGSPALTISDLGSNVALAAGTVFTLIDYSGAWNLGTFLDLADDSTFISGMNNFKIDYNDPNFGGTALTLTVQAIPEPGTLALVASGVAGLCLLRRRRLR
jgi:fibronectin-binding autotransporter adhesin